MAGRHAKIHATPSKWSIAAAIAWGRGLEEKLWTVPEDALRGIKRRVWRWLQILDRSVLGFWEHQAHTNASALTYTTFLASIPLLAVLISVLKGFNAHEPAFHYLMGLPLVEESKSAQDALIQIKNVVDDTEFTGLGAIGFIALMLTSLSLISRIEAAMNKAWGVNHGRPLGRKLADYLNLLVVLIIVLIVFSTSTFGRLLAFEGIGDWFGINIGGVQTWLLQTFPYMMIWPVLIFIYFYIPNTRVSWRSAIFGGFVAGAVFQFLQMFIFGVIDFSGNKNAIYGTFGGVVILVIWAYISWSVVLWGMELTSAHQNLQDWRRRKRGWRNTPVERETLALRLTALLARPLLGLEGGARQETGELADTLRVPTGPVADLLDLFQSHGLVVQSAGDGGYLLARTPDTVTALDVLRLVRQGNLNPPPTVEPAKSDENPTADFGQSLRHQLESCTIKDLTEHKLEEIQTFTF